MSEGNHISKEVSSEALSVVIVGAGPAGLFAAFELGLYGIHCHIIDSLAHAGGQCMEFYPDKPIYDIPGIVKITGKQLISQLLEQNKPFHPTFHFNSEVQHIIKDHGYTLQLQDGSVLQSKVIILATGVGKFIPIKPSIDLTKFEDKSVFYSIQNIQDFQNKKVVVFGGGNTALDFVFHLLNHGAKVTLVHRSDKFKASLYAIEKLHVLIDKGSIEFHQGTLKELQSSGSKTMVRIQSREEEQVITQEADKILICFGFNVNIHAKPLFPIDYEEAYIVVNPANFATSADGIYAVGDCVTYPGKQKLILSGFHESALMAMGVYKYLNPNEKPPKGHSTGNTHLRESHQKST